MTQQLVQIQNNGQPLGNLHHGLELPGSAGHLLLQSVNYVMQLGGHSFGADQAAGGEGSDADIGNWQD